MTSVPLSIYQKCVFSDFFTKINTFEFQLNNDFSGCFYSNDSMYYSCFMDSLSQYFFHSEVLYNFNRILTNTVVC